MYYLKIARHGKFARDVFEVWNGATLMGVIYPTETGIKIVSKFVAGDPEGAVKIERSPPLPSILVSLNKRGCGVLFFKRGPARILFFRRDNKPDIPFPDHIDILGGHVEPDETPEEAIVREMAEELVDLRTGEPFVLRSHWRLEPYVDERGTEQHIFLAEADFELEDLRLLEGKELLWLNEEQSDATEFAFGFHHVVMLFFRTLRGDVIRFIR